VKEQQLRALAARLDTPLIKPKGTGHIRKRRSSE